jgi:hypothetical protein
LAARWGRPVVLLLPVCLQPCATSTPREYLSCAVLIGLAARCGGLACKTLSSALCPVSPRPPPPHTHTHDTYARPQPPTPLSPTPPCPPRPQCRCCGGVFCSKCSTKTMDLAAMGLPAASQSHKGGFTLSAEDVNTTEHRVCDWCFSVLKLLPRLGVSGP